MIKSVNRDLLLYAMVALGLVLGFSVALRARAESKPGTPPPCPDTASGESTEDCPWAGVARQLMAEADAGSDRQVGARLKQLLPQLDEAIHQDSLRKSWRYLWGRSINYDEHAKGVIVHPAIVEALIARFGIRTPMNIQNIQEEKHVEGSASELLGKSVLTDPAGHQLVHAGLEHTYGYLLSVLKTSFGYKRARWVNGEIEKGFELPAGTLGPQPPSGTLFANVTYFAGKIAFRDNEARLSTLEQGRKDLAPKLRDFDFSKLAPIRLEEVLKAKDSGGQSREIVLRTDLVPFRHPQKNTHLLVYSISDPLTGGDLLITAFPVDQKFANTATDENGLGKDKLVQTRYNAFVEGVTGTSHKGVRRIVPGSKKKST
jgi:hypothetical protein